MQAPLQKPNSVRIATVGDWHKLFTFLMELDRFNNDTGLKVNPMRVAHVVDECCRGKGGIAGIIDAPDGSIAGSIGIRAGQPWWSDDWELSEYWLFVRPEYRKGTNYGRDLFRFAAWHREDISRTTGTRLCMDISWIGHEGNMNPKVMNRLWACNSRPVGALFRLEGSKETT